MGPVDGEALSPELVTQVILIQLRELLLELRGRGEAWQREGKESPRGPGARPSALPSPESVTLNIADGRTQDKITVSIPPCKSL